MPYYSPGWGCVKSRSSSDFARTKVHLEHPKALYILTNDLKMTFLHSPSQLSAVSPNLAPGWGGKHYPIYIPSKVLLLAKSK